MPKSIADLARSYLTNPAHIAVTPVATTAERIEQKITFVNQAEKQALLTLTLRDASVRRALVFTRTKHGADRVVRHLDSAGVKAAAIHGDLRQSQREKSLADFLGAECRTDSGNNGHVLIPYGGTREPVHCATRREARPISWVAMRDPTP